MRIAVVSLMVLALAACADRAPPRFGPGGPPPGGMGGPPGEGPPGGRHGRLFISPMGEPFREAEGEGDLARRWFDGADADHDGRLTAAEMAADAARFFKLVDVRGDGEIDPDDMARYETELVPEIRIRGDMGGGGPRGGRGGPRGGGGPGGGGPGGPGGPGGHGGGGPGGPGGFAGGAAKGAGEGRRGASRFGYLDLPQPIAAADRNFNRGIDPAEFALAAQQRFALLDRNGDGFLDWSELPESGRPHGRQEEPSAR